jgi:hypothetical protein
MQDVNGVLLPDGVAAVVRRWLADSFSRPVRCPSLGAMLLEAAVRVREVQAEETGVSPSHKASP